MGDIADKTGSIADRAHDSDWLDHAVRAGMVAYGLVHLMIAWLALQLVFGDRSGSASSSGALHQLAKQPFGEVLIWLISLGMFLLVAWRLLEAATGHEDEDGGSRTAKRLMSVGKAVIYGSLGVTALKVAIGSGSKGGSDGTTATVMGLPAGPWLVAAVGLAIIAYGGNLVRRAWTEEFAEHLTGKGKSGDSGSAYVMFGKVGYQAKGVAIGMVGALFIYAAVTHDPKKSGGLDQALQKLLEQPFGPYLLGIIAVGIGCYGLFCFARARHLDR